MVFELVCVNASAEAGEATAGIVTRARVSLAVRYDDQAQAPVGVIAGVDIGSEGTKREDVG